MFRCVCVRPAAKAAETMAGSRQDVGHAPVCGCPSQLHHHILHSPRRPGSLRDCSGSRTRARSSVFSLENTALSSFKAMGLIGTHKIHKQCLLHYVCLSFLVSRQLLSWSTTPTPLLPTHKHL